MGPSWVIVEKLRNPGTKGHTTCGWPRRLPKHDVRVTVLREEFLPWSGSGAPRCDLACLDRIR